MKKTIFIFVLFTFAVMLSAGFSDQFPMGTYSYLFDSTWNNTHKDVLCSWMDDLGYNTNIMQVFSEDVCTNLYDTMRNNNLDAIVIDRAWNSSDDRRYATNPVSTGCYYKFEAEFENSEPVTGTDNIDSQYWYGTRTEFFSEQRNRLGAASSIPGATPYGMAWKCEPYTEPVPPEGGVPPIPPIPGFTGEGYAFTNLTYRWLGRDQDNHPTNIRVGSEFKLYKYSSDPASDFLYVKFRFKFVDIPNPAEEEMDRAILLTFKPNGYPYSGGGHSSTSEALRHINGVQSGEVESYLTVGQYNSLPLDLNGRFATIELKISYQELINKNLLIEDPASSSRWLLVNFNPSVFYHNNGTFYLDYIEIEDQMHREFISDLPGYASGIGRRLLDIIPTGYENTVTHVYTMDEPNQPQFHSYNKIQQILNTNGIDPLAAVYDQSFRRFDMDGTGTKFYDHIDGFKKTAMPNIIMPDIYPIRADAVNHDWNSESDVVNSLQWMLDNKLIAGYNSAKHRAPSDPDRPFYPVVQAFGSWNIDQWTSWILPPPAMQQMLQYMPLCFDADGIFNYRLFGLQRINNIDFKIVGDYAACNAQVGVDNFNQTPDKISIAIPSNMTQYITQFEMQILRLMIMPA